MADASGIRVLRVLADDREIAAEQRVRVSGKSTMTCLPDPWVIDIFNLGSEDLATLRRCETVRVLGANDSLLCSGNPADILIRQVNGQEVVEIMVIEGEAFWRSSVVESIAAGTSVEQTIRTLLARCSSPIPLAACPEIRATVPRGQTFFGRTADYVNELCRAADCRGWTWKNALWMTRIGEGVPRSTIRDDDLLRDVETMTGAILCETRMIGMQTGQLVRMDTEKCRGVYRVAAQSIDADNYTGEWSCSLTLMDETEAGLGLEAWEGIM